MIQFGNPAALWFLALIIPIVLLYLLKRRRQDKVVPSVYLWKQALEDTQASTPFQKLRSNLLLWLQILIVVLLTALLAQPYLSSPLQESRRWILVIDRSASMQALDEMPNRFEAARKKLTDVLESAGRSDEVMLISAGSQASILHNFTTDPARVAESLKELSAEDVSAKWEDLFLMLKPLLKRSPKPKVVIASDFANIPETLSSLEFDAIRVGKNTANLGIIRCTIDHLPDTLQDQLLFFQMKNFSDQPLTTGVEVRQEDRVVDAFELSLQPQQVVEKTLRVIVADRSKISIRIEKEDALALDNDFVLIAEPRKKIAVNNRTGNAFLARALQVLPSVQSSSAAPIQIANQVMEGPGLYFLRGGAEDTAAITQWNSAAPQLRFVDAGLWKISGYDILEAPPGAEILLEIPQGVVGYAMENGRNRRIVLGFPIDGSNLPLLAGFPIFVANSLEWIHGGLQPPHQTVTNPQMPQEGPVGPAFVNFADAAESDLTPQSIQARSVSETHASVLRQDFSKWFLLALLAVVILEWWVFHRKEFV